MVKRSNKLSYEDFSPRKLSPAKKVQEITFDDAIRVFLQDCKIRNLSVHTIDYYSEKLKQFNKLLGNAGVKCNPNGVTLDMIKEHIIIQNLDKGNTEVTVNIMLRAIRAFFNYLYEEGYVNVNPVDRLKMLKENKKVVETFTPENVRLLLGQPDLRTFTGQRDYTVMMLMLETGVRVRELCDITVNDIDWKDGLITVDGKGYKQRRVPIQTTMKRQLNRYVDIRGDLADTHELFVTIDNTPLSKRQVQDRLRSYGKKSGIKDVRVSPHTFRHTFAKMSIINGANIFALQKILGHTTLEMVRRYVNMFSSEVQDQHRKFSPVEKLF